MLSAVQTQRSWEQAVPWASRGEDVASQHTGVCQCKCRQQVARPGLCLRGVGEEKAMVDVQMQSCIPPAPVLLPRTLLPPCGTAALLEEEPKF